MPHPVDSIMPVDPVFRNDKDFLPLQAADLVACMRRYELAESRPDLQWISDALNRMKQSDGTKVFRADDIEEYVEIRRAVRALDGWA